MRVSVSSVRQADSSDWLRMREALWPSEPGQSHAAEVEQYFAGQLQMPLEVLIARDESGTAIGCAELSIRAYAEDCVTGRVAYLEGWYVIPEARRHGVGRALIEAAEDWARQQGCTEFASDALLDNDVSASAHEALGFTETVRIRCFKKTLQALEVSPGNQTH